MRHTANITEYLKEKYGPWGWMGQRAHDACGINGVLPLDFIISCDYGLDIKYYFREDDVFAVEKKIEVRKDWSNEDLNASLKGSLGREVFNYLNSLKRPANLLCYRSVKKLETNGSLLRFKPRVYAMPERLKKRFDNKTLLHRSLPKLSLPYIPGRVEKLGRVTFNVLRKELSLPFVMQFPYGSSGHYTFIIRDERKFKRYRRAYPDQTVVLRKYIDGYSLNANAVIVSTENGPLVACSFPSVQITGAPECSNFETSFCGNDYSSARDLDKKVLKQAENIMRTIGTWMAGSGFRGVFGMDLVVKDGAVYPVEINPRFQNSTSLYTTLERMQPARKGALFLLHIAEFLQKNDKVMRKYVKDFPFEELLKPLRGSQVILHNLTARSVITGGLTPGVYSGEGRRLVLQKEGASIDDCRRTDFLVTCGVPKSFMVIEPNAPICKIQSLREALDPSDRRSLSQDTRKAASNVYAKLKLKEEREVEAIGAR
ncbi:MAG: ATP-grasp domain-containing protein [Candidatus Omnitrophota bacterium]